MEMHLFGPAWPPPPSTPGRESATSPTGLIQSWGTYMSEATTDDWFRSDYIFIWISNPNYTYQSDAHFLYEARYRGAKIVSVAPTSAPPRSTPIAG